MSERDIRAYFRGAVVAKILDGWYRPSAGQYITAPRNADTVRMTVDEAASYCAALPFAGVEPVYRDTEPVLMDFE